MPPKPGKKIPDYFKMSTAHDSSSDESSNAPLVSKESGSSKPPSAQGPPEDTAVEQADEDFLARSSRLVKAVDEKSLRGLACGLGVADIELIPENLGEIEARLWQTKAQLDDGFITMVAKSKRARSTFGGGLDESAMKGKDKQRYDAFKYAADPKTGPVEPRSTVGGLFRDAVKKQEKWRSLASGADQKKLKELRKLFASDELKVIEKKYTSTVTFRTVSSTYGKMRNASQIIRSQGGWQDKVSLMGSMRLFAQCILLSSGEIGNT